MVGVDAGWALLGHSGGGLVSLPQWSVRPLNVAVCWGP